MLYLYHSYLVQQKYITILEPHTTHAELYYMCMIKYVLLLSTTYHLYDKIIMSSYCLTKTMLLSNPFTKKSNNGIPYFLLCDNGIPYFRCLNTAINKSLGFYEHLEALRAVGGYVICQRPTAAAVLCMTYGCSCDVYDPRL